MEQLKKFLELLRTDPKALEMLESKEKPESLEEIIRSYAEAAKEFGFSLTEEEIAEGIKALSKEQSARTAQAEKAIQKLDPEELRKVAGGADSEDCWDTFKNKENCWSEDGCDQFYYAYPEYICKSVDNDGKSCFLEY